MMRNSIILIVAWFSLGAQGADLQLDPKVIQKTPIQLRPVLTLAPSIIRLNSAASCLAKGKTFSVSGSNLGSRSQYDLVLHKSGASIVQVVGNWTTTSISATLGGGGLRAGETYALAIADKTGKIRSNTNVTLKVCALAALGLKTPVQALKPALRLPGTVKPIQPGVRQPGLHPPPQQPPEEDDGDAGTPGPAEVPESGSLLEGELPQLPESGQESASSAAPANVVRGEIIMLTATMDEAKRIHGELAGLGIRVKKRKRLKKLGMVFSVLRSTSPPGELLAQLRQSHKNAGFDYNVRMAMAKSRRFSQKNCAEGIRVGTLDRLSTRGKPGHMKVKTYVRYGGLTAVAGRNDKQSVKWFRGARRSGGNEITAAQFVEAADWLASQNIRVLQLNFRITGNVVMDRVLAKMTKLGIKRRCR